MKLTALLEKTIPALGYELVDFDYSPRSGLMRIFIDTPQGVMVDDCVRVSNHLTRLFPVEGIAYERLEVSSPGLDRPLTKPADYIRFNGEEVQLKLRVTQDNTRKVKGHLRGLTDQTVKIETSSGLMDIALSNIERARLVPRIEWRKS